MVGWVVEVIAIATKIYRINCEHGADAMLLRQTQQQALPPVSCLIESMSETLAYRRAWIRAGEIIVLAKSISVRILIAGLVEGNAAETSRQMIGTP